MSEPMRVAVVRGESLLEQGIKHALMSVEDIEVEVVPGDAADLLAALRSFRPDAVIVDEMDQDFVNYILARSPGTVVIAVSLHTPTVAVYRSRIAEVANIEGLVEQLRLERGKIPVTSH